MWIKLVLWVTNLEVKGIINQLKGSPPPSVDECDNVIKLQILSIIYLYLHAWDIGKLKIIYIIYISQFVVYYTVLKIV